MFTFTAVLNYNSQQIIMTVNNEVFKTTANYFEILYNDVLRLEKLSWYFQKMVMMIAGMGDRYRCWKNGNNIQLN